MPTLLLMVRKDLTRKARAPLGLLLVLAFPIMFSAIIGLAFSTSETPRVYLLVENLDGGILGDALLSALGSEQMAQYFQVETVGEDGLERIRRGEGSALLRIPGGFTEDLVKGDPTTLQLIRNPAQGIMPEIAQQLTAVLADVLDSGSRVLRQPLDTLAPLLQKDAPDLDLATFSNITVAVYESLQGAGEFLFPPVIKISSVNLGQDAGLEDESPDTGFNVFQVFLFVFPGVSVYALFMVGDLAMRDILVEGEAGTLQRQIQGPVTPGMVLRAKAAFGASLAMISLLILSVIGGIAASEPVNVPAFLLLSLALVLAVVGTAAAIYGATGNVKRGSVVSSVLYLLLAFAGGSFMDVNALPGALRLVAPFSPFYWGTQGYRRLLEGGVSIADLLPSVAILGTTGMLLLLLGSVSLKRRMSRRGGL